MAQQVTRHGVTSEPLRAPRRHGRALQIPALDQAPVLYAANVVGRSALDAAMGPGFRQAAQDDLVQRASAYSRQYRDIGCPPSSQPSDPARGGPILSGHQPQLFHAGVWYKNFVLSELGRRLDTWAINIIIDNDVAAPTRVAVPQGTRDRVRRDWVAYDAPIPPIPYELRPIADRDVFDSFDRRLAEALGDRIGDPLVERLWPYARQAADRWGTLGQAVAAARHRFEQDAGLDTLELPLSQVCQSPWFWQFTARLIEQLPQLQAAHNDALAEYRRANKIRSRARPVPALTGENEWLESPFWVWRADDPVRRRLFVRHSEKLWELTDRAQWRTLIDPRRAEEDWLALAGRGVAIRPRALITTMYLRLVLSDLFLHGIGGAKYDELTDAIIERLWGVTPPGFLTLTATMHLPCAIDNVERSDVVHLDELLRQWHYHPEIFLDDRTGAVGQLIADKKRHLASKPLARNGQRRHWHEQLDQLNARLREPLEAPRQRLAAERDAAREHVAAAQILNSREYAFCLFPATLVGELKRLAAIGSA
jgi:hypothetical protein